MVEWRGGKGEGGKRAVGARERWGGQKRGEGAREREREEEQRDSKGYFYENITTPNYMRYESEVILSFSEAMTFIKFSKKYVRKFTDALL